MEKNSDIKDKLPHKRSSTFISDHATGMMLSGPTNDGLYHLTFYSDAVDYKSETLITPPSEGQEANKDKLYKLGIEEDDLENFREDKARISLSLKTAQNLRDLLNEFLTEDNK